MHAAWTRDGRPVFASASVSGEFEMPCCRAAAVLNSDNGALFFTHAAAECDIAPELKWHREGKVSLLAALVNRGIEGRDTVNGVTPDGTKWKADVLFSVGGRRIAIQLQRAYQHLREFRRRQQRFAACDIECYWLFRREAFMTLINNVAPSRSALAELPVAMLEQPRVEFGDSKYATVPDWLAGVLDGSFRYRDGWWNLG